VIVVQSWCGNNITEKVYKILTDLEPCHKDYGYNELHCEVNFISFIEIIKEWRKD
jgi:hypothetical protein